MLPLAITELVQDYAGIPGTCHGRPGVIFGYLTGTAEVDLGIVFVLPVLTWMGLGPQTMYICSHAENIHDLSESTTHDVDLGINHRLGCATLGCHG